MIPQRRPGQSLASHKQECAEWMGYATVAEMDRDHDRTHAALCEWLGVESLSLKEASGRYLEPWERRLAGIEEDLVMRLQRFCVQAGGKLP